MRHPSPTILSKLARLVPVLLLIFGLVAAPAWGGVQKQAESQDVTTCCPSATDHQPDQSDGDEDCCGKTCHGGVCPCAKLILIAGLDLAPTSIAITPAIPFLELSALSLSEADPIFHPPRA
jgi:hypothetical protein